MDGAGEADLPRKPEVVEPNDDLRLWLIVLGGFMGSAWVVGVLGCDGRGDSALRYADSVDSWARSDNSGGAGDEIRRLGRSIF